MIRISKIISEELYLKTKNILGAGPYFNSHSNRETILELLDKAKESTKSKLSEKNKRD